MTQSNFAPVAAMLMILTAFASANAQQARVQTPPLTREVKLQTFDEVWSTMNDKYYDRSFKGLDWKAIGDQYRPRAMSAQGHVEFHAVLNEMVKLLGDSHLSVIPPALPGRASALLTAVGIELHAGGQRAIVARIDRNSPAEAAGIAVGDEIMKVDGTAVVDIAAAYVKSMRTELKPLARRQTWLAVHQKIRGKPGTAVTLTLSTAAGPRVIELVRPTAGGHVGFKLPSFRKLETGEGLLAITSFHLDLDSLFKHTFTECNSCSTLIIDVRGNSGGFAHNISKLLGYLMTNSGVAGIQGAASGKTDLAFDGRGKNAFNGKVVVLTDGRSSSAAEVFAAAVQDLGRGTVIGTRTGGAVLLSDIKQLASGGSQLFPFAEFRRATGLQLEGVGVIPDVIVGASVEEIRAGRDAVLDAARNIRE